MKERQTTAPSPIAAGTALVNLAENKPPAERRSNSARALAASSESFKHQALAKRQGFIKGLHWLNGTMNLSLIALGAATLFTPLAAVVWGGTAGFFDHQARRDMQKKFDDLYKERQRIYKISQKDFYRHKQQELLRLAESVLEKKQLIDERALSYLVLMPGEIIRQASDQLAISVLQARAVLEQDRVSETGRVLTFASLDLDPGREDHRAILREKLYEKDAFLGAAGAAPAFTPLEEKVPVMFDTSLKATFKRIAILPYHMWKDKKKLRSYEPPPLPDPVVPPLQNAPQLAQALGDFESREGKLDLPALRGWPPPAPRRFPNAAPRIGGVRQLPRP